MTEQDELIQLEQSLQVIIYSHRSDLILEKAHRILAIDPNNRLGYVALIFAYNRSQQYDLMLRACLDALALWPDDDWFYHSLYLYYLNTGVSYLKGKEAIEKAIELSPSNARYYRDLGEIYLINREADKAVKYLSKAVELDPDNAEFRSRLALGLLREHKVSESLKMAEKALRDDPSDNSVLDTAGLIYALAGELEKAEDLFKSALRDRPTYDYFQKHLDLVYREKSDRESRIKRGMRYTPLYLRHKGTKLHFDEDKQ